MLKVIAKAISASRAWVLLIAFLVAIVVIVESSQPFQECVKEIYYNPATENFEKSITSFPAAFGIHRDCFGNFTHDNAEAIIAAFTIILSFSTIFLWVATRDLVRGAEKTAKQQLRAHIGTASSGNDIPSLNIGQRQMGSISVTGYGQTPALKLRYWGDMIIREYPLATSLLAQPFGRICRPINPQQTVVMRFVTAHQLTTAEAQDIRAGTQCFYLYGHIEYFDIFGERRETTFRYRYSPFVAPPCWITARKETIKLRAPACRSHLNHGRPKVKRRIIARIRTREPQELLG
jgi:hypothetical protein